MGNARYASYVLRLRTTVNLEINYLEVRKARSKVWMIYFEVKMQQEMSAYRL